MLLIKKKKKDHIMIYFEYSFVSNEIICDKFVITPITLNKSFTNLILWWIIRLINDSGSFKGKILLFHNGCTKKYLAVCGL